MTAQAQAARDSQANYDRYIGMTGEPKTAHTPLERDTLRRFAQAIMDPDPVYYDERAAKASRFAQVVAPPLYPAHAFRTAAGAPDPFEIFADNPDSDGTAGNEGMFYGLPEIPSPYKRLLNGGNELTFYRALALGERCVVTPRYADVKLKEGKNGFILLVVVETTYRTEQGEMLLVNRQTLIWR
ncbi:MAG: MaoC family dehydratase N-terminal domain-containing protein [Polaromonas sp.]|uniref:FAS1-like dehydratase domain-containing protein n=1 Tax=Polaromonas sp. TaxID=1869339 RepID=UPI0025D344FE|nr:MaoC family dehydratase N-terminal domain-containing protein [Polaromonas sp.]MBI2727733.1 MaoC family dehydratase N-terminal domain-containing protein [Polaromonas sp.]